MSATLIVVDDLRNDNATESYDVCGGKEARRDLRAVVPFLVL
jgi:hypothetical protein